MKVGVFCKNCEAFNTLGYFVTSKKKCAERYNGDIIACTCRRCGQSNLYDVERTVARESLFSTLVYASYFLVSLFVVYRIYHTDWENPTYIYAAIITLIPLIMVVYSIAYSLYLSLIRNYNFSSKDGSVISESSNLDPEITKKATTEIKKKDPLTKDPLPV